MVAVKGSMKRSKVYSIAIPLFNSLHPPIQVAPELSPIQGPAELSVDQTHGK